MGKRIKSISCCSLWLFLILALLLSQGAWASLQATTTTTATKEMDEIDLDSLSDLELEEICALRGFELVKEGVFSHDDYVEAARQCLAIERDM
jgi:hypothetical protein